MTQINCATGRDAIMTPAAPRHSWRPARFASLRPPFPGRPS
ncbi:hypothetical protein C7S13_7853 [Burkholderia cepacia]|nr:hypothetical protein [Burkholderia cepacia]